MAGGQAGASWRRCAHGARLARAAADPVLTAEVVAEIGSELREYVRDLLGITELDERVSELMPLPASDGYAHGKGNGAVSEDVALRVKGAMLLRAAAEVDARRTAPIRPTHASSPSSPPTRRGSSGCWRPRAPSPRSTCAPPT